jgi:hypothetical protein
MVTDLRHQVGTFLSGALRDQVDREFDRIVACLRFVSLDPAAGIADADDALRIGLRKHKRASRRIVACTIVIAIRKREMPAFYDPCLSMR